MNECFIIHLLLGKKVKNFGDAWAWNVGMKDPHWAKVKAFFLVFFRLWKISPFKRLASLVQSPESWCDDVGGDSDGDDDDA